jgi:hypothetical protein
MLIFKESSEERRMVTCDKGMLVLTPVYWDKNHLIFHVMSYAKRIESPGGIFQD